MAKTTFIQSNTKQGVDSETGELYLIEESKLVKVQTSTEEFFQVYCRLIASVYELKYADDIKILIKFCEIAEFNTGRVMIPAQERKLICETMGIHTTNLSKSIKRLKDKKLIDGDKGSYIINPIIFWKGEKSKRAQLLKDEGLSITFNFKE